MEEHRCCQAESFPEAKGFDNQVSCVQCACCLHGGINCGFARLFFPGREFGSKSVFVGLVVSKPFGELKMDVNGQRDLDRVPSIELCCAPALVLGAAIETPAVVSGARDPMKAHRMTSRERLLNEAPGKGVNGKETEP